MQIFQPKYTVLLYLYVSEVIVQGE